MRIAGKFLIGVFLLESLLCSLVVAEPVLASSQRLSLTLNILSTSDFDTNADFQLVLTNQSDENITLVADKFYSTGLSNTEVEYSEYVKKFTVLDGDPRPDCGSVQSTAGDGKIVRVTLTLEPDKSHIIELGGLKRRGLRLGNESGCFKADGIYTIWAKLDVSTDKGEKISLQSEPKQIILGGITVKARPEAKVIAINEPERVATLDIGSLNGIKVGSRFGYNRSRVKSYVFTVTSVSSENCEAQITYHCNEGPYEMLGSQWRCGNLSFPKAGDFVDYHPSEWT